MSAVASRASHKAANTPDIIQESLRQELMNRMRKGFVLHMDPDYIIRTYGDVTTGPRILEGTISPRYAVCVGREKDVTFWSMATTQIDNVHKIQIPIEARKGAWAENPVQTAISKDQIWVMTAAMAAEAYMHVNTLRSSMKWSWVDYAEMADWPVTPKKYTVCSTKLSNGSSLRAPSAVVPQTPVQQVLVPQAAPVVKSVAKDAAWRTWIRSVRVAAGLTLPQACEKIASPFLFDDKLGLVETSVRLFSPDERDAWAKAFDKAKDPMIETIPVLTNSELAVREKTRAAWARRAEAKAKASTAPLIPQDAPTTPPPEPQETPAVPTPTVDPTQRSRATLGEEVAAIMNHPELSITDVLEIHAAAKAVAKRIMLRRAEALQKLAEEM